MTSERGEGFGFAVAHDAPIPYMQRISDYYVALGYGAPYEWAHYAQGAVPALKKPLAQSRSPSSPRPHLSARQGRPGARRALQFGGQILQGLFRRHGPRPRPAHLACRHRPQAHDGRGLRHLVPAARAAPRRQARPHRLARAALSRAADQPQPSRHARGRLPEVVARCRTTASRRRSCCPTAPCAIRAPASPRARWRRAASPPS
jgi:hypothetical protein